VPCNWIKKMCKYTQWSFSQPLGILYYFKCSGSKKSSRRE
jgi:hypothetical protein